MSGVSLSLSSKAGGKKNSLVAEGGDFGDSSDDEQEGVGGSELNRFGRVKESKKVAINAFGGKSASGGANAGGGGVKPGEMVIPLTRHAWEDDDEKKRQQEGAGGVGGATKVMPLLQVRIAV